MRNDIKRIIDNVYSFFISVMIGLPGRTAEVQAQWRGALINFLQANRVTEPFFQ